MHVGTIADKLRLGHGVTINCGNPDCRHRATMDLAKLPAEMTVASLVARAICSECGTRWPRLSITISVENAPSVIAERRAK